MSDHSRAENRERRSAWFIVVAMLAATVYVVSQGGLLNNLLPGDDAPVPAAESRAGQYRRAVTLPLHFADTPSAERSRVFSQLQEYGINWVEIPLPAWQATSRHLEYNSFDLSAASNLVTACRDAGFGVTLLPLYWNGDTLSPLPSGEPSSSLLQSYRDLALDLAALASSSGADALLLDALFGHSSVSATEWIALIEELRAAYAGALEIRIGDEATPLLYLRHFDGAHVAADSAAIVHLRHESAKAALYLRTGLRDRHEAGAFPWDVHSTGLAYDPDLIMQVLHTAEQPECNGFALSGSYAFTNVSVDGTPLGGILRSFRDRQQRRQLERRRERVSPGNE